MGGSLFSADFGHFALLMADAWCVILGSKVEESHQKLEDWHLVSASCWAWGKGVRVPHNPLGCFPDRSEEVKRLPLALDSYWRPGQPMMIEIWEAIFHSIGFRENLKENPIFHGKKHGFLMFPVDFPFNQSSDFSEMMQWIEVVQHTHQSSSDSIHDQLSTDTHNRLGVLLHCLCMPLLRTWR